MRIYIILLAALLTLSNCTTQQKYDDLEARYYMALQENIRQKEKTNLLEVEVINKKEEIALLKKEILDAQHNLEALQNDFDALAQDSSKTLQENAKKNKDLLANLENAREDLTAKENELNNKINRINQLEDLIAQQKSVLASLKNSINNALQNFTGKGITVNERNGKIYISMENKLLFASGKWKVQEQGINALNELSSVLKKQKDLEIIIEGHTDNVPYTPKNGEVLDNWDLSVMRATSITKILEQKGIKPQQMTAGGRSKYIPIEDNTTTSGKAKNRRVEIIITPNLDKINKLLNGI